MLHQGTSSFKRRLLNLFLLEYTPHELWQLFRLRFTHRRPFLTYNKHHSLTSNLLSQPIFVISLPFRTDRQTKIEKQFKNLNLPYTLRDAIHGQQIEMSQLSVQQFSPTAKKYLSKGSIGCALSHISLWQEIQEQNIEYAFIFEDDVVLHEDFPLLLEAWMPEIPNDFDILFLGSGKTTSADIVHFIAPHVFVPAYPREGLYGYVVSKQGIENILQHIFPIHLASGGIDTMIGKLVRKGKLRAYHLLPVLCQADMQSASNIANPMDQHKVLDARE